jgi:hypothetical protein
MKCPIKKQRYEPIADELVDHGTLLYPNHTIYTHLGCTLFRSVIGISLMSKSLSPQSRKTIILMIVSVLIIFAWKYLYNVVMHDIPFWKAYPRMLLAYSVALYLIHIKQESYAGMLIVADALMGIQSRHMASVLTCGIANSQ